MKRIFLGIVLLLSICNVIAQSTQIWTGDGVTLSFTKKLLGLVKNPKTGKEFSRYEIYLHISNSSNKDMRLNSPVICIFRYPDLDILNDDDITFCADGTTTNEFEGNFCKKDILCAHATAILGPRYAIGSTDQEDPLALDGFTLDFKPIEEKPQTSNKAQGIVKPNYAEFTFQGVKYSRECRASSNDVQCSGSVMVAMNPDEVDDKKLVIYNMPKGSSGTYDISASGDGCVLKFILYWFEAGKYKYTTPVKGALTKTSAGTFTFAVTLSNGEPITGKGSYSVSN